MTAVPYHVLSTEVVHNQCRLSIWFVKPDEKSVNTAKSQDNCLCKNFVVTVKKNQYQLEIIKYLLTGGSEL